MTKTMTQIIRVSPASFWKPVSVIIFIRIVNMGFIHQVVTRSPNMKTTRSMKLCLYSNGVRHECWWKSLHLCNRFHTVLLLKPISRTFLGNHSFGQWSYMIFDLKTCSYFLRSFGIFGCALKDDHGLNGADSVMPFEINYGTLKKYLFVKP